MEKILREAENFREADGIADDDDRLLTYQERLKAFMEMMQPYYEAYPGFQRVYRTADYRERKVSDDWRVRVQSVPKSSDDR